VSRGHTPRETEPSPSEESLDGATGSRSGLQVASDSGMPGPRTGAKFSTIVMPLSSRMRIPLAAVVAQRQRPLGPQPAVLSPLPDASRPSGSTARAFTPFVCPFSTALHTPVEGRHTRIVLSQLPRGEPAVGEHGEGSHPVRVPLKGRRGRNRQQRVRPSAGGAQGGHDGRPPRDHGGAAERVTLLQRRAVR